MTGPTRLQGAVALAALLLAACGCSKGQAHRDDPHGQPPAASAASTSDGKSRDEGTPHESATSAPTAPAGLAGMLLPPKGHGVTASRVAGCLAESSGSEADAQRFPAAATTRGGPPAVRLSTTPTGLMVTHEATHACCLTADITTVVEGRAVVVRETYAGTPCRCQCGSTVRTAVGLEPGEYQFALEVVEAGQTTRSAEQTFAIVATGGTK